MVLRSRLHEVLGARAVAGDHAKARSTPAPRAKTAAIGLLWRLFLLLVVLQAADLTTTYWGLAAGGREGNTFMRAVLFTPLAPVPKAVALAFLASLILGSSRRGWPAPGRLLVAASVIVMISAATVLNNLTILIAR
jgi:Domain of unknown function (DUF5658)